MRGIKTTVILTSPANSIASVPAASTSAVKPYWGRMLMLPTGQVMYTAGRTSVDLYTPSGSPDPVWLPTITGCPSSVRRGQTYTLSGRQINGLTQCSYYGNDATNATNYPIIRLRSTSSSNVYYCRTSNYSTMGLQTGTIIHNCRFFVPSSVPLGNYCLEVVANGISSACRTVGVTTKWFKELKYEIKEKFEIIENLKEIRDIKVKQVPDIVDNKLIREDFDFLQRIQEDWVKTVRSLAESVDVANAELSRTFITPDERPIVGPPDPIVEKLNVPVISAAEARRGQEKEAFNDGRKELAVSREAAAFLELVHSLSKSGAQNIRTETRTRKGKGRPRDKA